MIFQVKFGISGKRFILINYLCRLYHCILRDNYGAVLIYSRAPI